MAVNFLLTDAHQARDDDPLGRSWVGWKPIATDDQLWEINRGLWILGDRIANERIATLSYDGLIQVVVEVSGRRRYDIDGQPKWALSGNVLRPGDPIHDRLKGSPAPRHRNPVSYFDTSSLESLSSVERARFAGRDRVTMVVTWNPEKWNPNDWATRDYPQDVEAVAAGGLVRGQWATGNRTSGIEPGDRVFFLRQGVEPRGIIGSGTTTSRIFTDMHWDDERPDGDANYVLIEWDTLLLPEDGLTHASLVEQIPDGGAWRPQSGGWVLRPGVAADLEALWAKHLGLRTPLPTRSSPRQGWQLDPVRRKKVEDAAQQRLMEHYRQSGWTVNDVRYGNPYDATATKDGVTKAPKPPVRRSSSPRTRCDGRANIQAPVCLASCQTSSFNPTEKSTRPAAHFESSNGTRTTPRWHPAVSTSHRLIRTCLRNPRAMSSHAKLPAVNRSGAAGQTV